MYKTFSNIERSSFIKSCLAVTAGLLCPTNSFSSGNNTPQVTRRNTKPAMFAEETEKGILCGLCPNRCILKESDLGLCRTRKVKDGKLYTLSYGNPCSINIDPIEKKPLYHFYPATRAFSIATAGCNLACLNCQNWTISATSPDKTRNYELMPGDVVENAIEGKCKTIAYTYTEPVTFFEYAYDSAIAAREKGLKNIIKSSGYINTAPLKKWCKVMDAANIDLKSFNNDTYMKLSRARLQPILDTLKTLKDNGVWLEITNLIVPSYTDKLDEIAAMCKWLSDNGFKETPLHFSRFFPLYKLDQLPPTPIETLQKAVEIAESEGMKYVYVGNVPGNESTNTKCPKCRTIIIERKGFTVTSFNMTDGKCNKCGEKIAGVF